MSRSKRSFSRISPGIGRRWGDKRGGDVVGFLRFRNRDNYLRFTEGGKVSSAEYCIVNVSKK